MHKTKCAVLLVLIGSQIGIIRLHLIFSTLILEWKFVKVVGGKVENIHSGIQSLANSSVHPGLFRIVYALSYLCICCFIFCQKASSSQIPRKSHCSTKMGFDSRLYPYDYECLEVILLFICSQLWSTVPFVCKFVINY